LETLPDISRVRLAIVGLENVGLKDLVSHYKLEESVHFEGTMGYCETLHYLGRSNVLVVLEAPYSEGAFLPSKFVDYVQTGRPVLAISPKEGTLNDLLSSYHSDTNMSLGTS
jgi:hypothetical protein